MDCNENKEHANAEMEKNKEHNVYNSSVCIQNEIQLKTQFVRRLLLNCFEWQCTAASVSRRSEWAMGTHVSDFLVVPFVAFVQKY